MAKKEAKKPKPLTLSVVPLDSIEVQMPDGSTVRMHRFTVFDQRNGTTMMQQNMLGEMEPVIIASMPIKVKEPSKLLAASGPLPRA